MTQEQHLLARDRQLRGEMTPFEARLWRHLSGSRLGFKFRRQHVIGNCVVDFLCPQNALIVEVDGDTHNSARDDPRDRLNASRGYSTIRFTNAEVGKDISAVLERLTAALTALPDRWPHPNPSPEGEGKA